MSQPLCRVCGAKATQKCGQCSISLYCGQECANTDWEHGHHARICSDADDLHTEALPLARRLFMESSLPTVHPEDRAEALALVDSLLMEHCAEEFFMENPHLIDEYLDQEEDEELIGAGLDEEEHLLNDLAEIRGEALAWLDEVHVRDAEDYPALYVSDMIGAEFGQHAQHWQEEYERVEATLKEKWDAVKTKLRAFRKKRKSKPRKRLRSPFRRGAAKAKATKKTSSRRTLRGVVGDLKSRVVTKRRQKSAERSRRRAEKKGMFKTKRNPTGKPMISRRERSKQRQESRRRSRSDASSSSSSAKSYSSSDEIAESPPVSPRRSQSAERRAQRAEEKARRRDEEEAARLKAAQDKAALEDYQRQVARQREDYQRQAQEDAARNERYLEQQRQIAREEELRRRELDAQKAETAARRAAADPDSPRLRERMAAKRRAQAEERAAAAAATVVSQGQPQMPGVSPTVVVVPQAVAPLPAPAPAPTLVAPRADVRTKRDSLTQKAMNVEQQHRYYQDEIRQLEEQIYRNQQAKAQLEQKLAAPSASEIEKHDWDSEMRRLVGRIQMDTQTMKETQQKVAAAQVQRDQIVQQLQQLPLTTSTCISWK